MLAPWRQTALHIPHYFDDMPYDLEVEDSHDWESHRPEDPDAYKPHPG